MAAVVSLATVVGALWFDALTLAMAWLMFEKVFPDAAKSLGN